MLPIKDPTLLKTQSLIDNQWTDATTGDTIDVTNPFDNQVIATIPSLEKSQVIDAVAIAHKAQIDWAQKNRQRARSYFKQLGGFNRPK